MNFNFLSNFQPQSRELSLEISDNSRSDFLQRENSGHDVRALPLAPPQLTRMRLCYLKILYFFTKINNFPFSTRISRFFQPRKIFIIHCPFSQTSEIFEEIKGNTDLRDKIQRRNINSSKSRQRRISSPRFCAFPGLVFEWSPFVRILAAFLCDF